MGRDVGFRFFNFKISLLWAMTNTSNFHQMQVDNDVFAEEINPPRIPMRKMWRNWKISTKYPEPCHHQYEKKKDLKEKNLGFLEILYNCDSFLEVSKPCIMRFYCFVVAKIAMDPKKCRVFGILRNTSKSKLWIIFWILCMKSQKILWKRQNNSQNWLENLKNNMVLILYAQVQ